jgi:hypothetical protein
MLCLKKDVNYRTPAKDLLYHQWVKSEEEKNKPPTSSDLSLSIAIGELEVYKEKLAKEMSKLPGHGEEDEETEERTATLELKTKMKKKPTKKNIKVKESPRQAQFSEPEISNAGRLKALELGIDEDPGFEDWDEDLGITTMDRANLLLRLPSGRIC